MIENCYYRRVKVFSKSRYSEVPSYPLTQKINEPYGYEIWSKYIWNTHVNTILRNASLDIEKINDMRLCGIFQEGENKQRARPTSGYATDSSAAVSADPDAAAADADSTAAAAAFSLSFNTSFSINSANGVNSFLSIKLNSFVKYTKCLKEVFKCASSCRQMTSVKWARYMWA